MATLRELQLKPGQGVIAIAATRHSPGRLESGLSLNSPGVEVNADGWKIISLEKPSSISGEPVNVLQLKWTTNSRSRDQIGSTFDFSPSYMNFTDEGDPRLFQELSSAGLRLKITMDLLTSASYEIVKIQDENV